jgi:hypothetical protein
VVSGVTAVVTAAASAGPDTDHTKGLPLGEILSGWRDLNSRPLDPQIGGPLQLSGLERAVAREARSPGLIVIGRARRWAHVGPNCA